MRAVKSLAGLWLAVFCMSVFAQARELPDFTRLVDEQGASVVNISTTQAARRSALPQVPGMEDDEVMEFFRRFVPRQPPGQGPERGPGRPESRSLGSGFILSADGYILTNAHVVDSADEINVKLTDKREFKAKVIGADKRTDVALIKIEGTNLPVVKFGDPNKLKVGEWVVAIGAPFGFENTVTAGIVSAKGRSLPQENFVPFIQTDVAINPGNSGGPLFNMRGEVVGINSQIYSRTGGFMGLSFAIPIDVAIDIQKQLREKICELMPTTSPRMLSSGPPELPGFTATSVWMNGTASRFGSPDRFSRLVAETMPAVTVFAKPKGEPMATTHSPTRSLFGSPKRTAGRPVASIFSTARSVRASAPITRALNSRLSVSLTLISSPPSTTWALVRM